MTISDWFEHDGKRHNVSVTVISKGDLSVTVMEGDNSLQLACVPMDLWRKIADMVRRMEDLIKFGTAENKEWE